MNNKKEELAEILLVGVPELMELVTDSVYITSSIFINDFDPDITELFKHYTVYYKGIRVEVRSLKMYGVETSDTPEIFVLADDYESLFYMKDGKLVTYKSQFVREK